MRSRALLSLPAATDPLWWRSAVIYQIYVRSFADGNGDGTGDLAGVRSRLGYLRDLGVDAIWFTPWYPSPLADGGYDVADYRDIHPAFGDARRGRGAHPARRSRSASAPSSTSSPTTSPTSTRGSRRRSPPAPARRERERFWFRAGSGADGDEMPNHWVSNFQGETWTRTTNPDGTPGEWYLHLFTPEQPDLNWNHPDVRREHEDILRFWFDRGVAGVRIDSAALLVKDPDAARGAGESGPGRAPEHQDRDELHDVYRGWRAVADSYPGTRVLVGEIWLPDIERFAEVPAPRRDAHRVQLRLHGPARGTPHELRESIDATLAAHAPVGAPRTWVLSNHDVTRPVTRYGREDIVVRLR